MGELKKWLDQKWVRIDTQGNIVGECGSSENKKNVSRPINFMSLNVGLYSIVSATEGCNIVP